MKKILSILCLTFPLAVFAESYPSINDAAFHGDVEAVDTFINNGARVDTRDNLGWTPLHNAVYGVNSGVPEILIEAGANANALTHSGMSPLHLLALFSCEDAFKHFLAEKKIFETFLTEEEKLGDIFLTFCAKVEATKEATARALVRAGANVAAVYGDASMTPLFLAARRGASGVVSVLLKEGKANVDARSFYEGSHGVSALHVAAKEGHVDVIRLLAEAGADMNAMDEMGKTPLHYAVIRGDLGPVQMLVELGAGSSIKDGYGHTPRELAAILEQSDRPDIFLRECYAPIVAYLDEVEGSLNGAL